jgi:signal transduction histidine kinase
VLICGAAVVAVVITAVVMIQAEETAEYREALDARLQGIGRAVLAIAESDPDVRNRSNVHFAAPDVEPETMPEASWQVWSGDGTLLMSSVQSIGNRPVMPLASRGLFSVDVGDKAYRVISLPSADKSLVVQAEEADNGLWAENGFLAYFHLALPLAFAPILVGSWLMLQRTVKSVNRLADQLRRRDPMDSTRLGGGELGPDVQPMAIAVDGLLERIAQLTSVERGLRGAVAHEIRGSLAGIRAQAQLARMAQAPDELDDALGLLMSGTDRASRMLDQILDLARVDGMQENIESQFQSLQLSGIYLQVKEEVAAKAAARRITLAARFEASRLRAIPTAFFMLLRNLLENAILYCPQGGRVEITSTLQVDKLVLTIDDSGRGIPVVDRERAFERFNRLGRGDTVGVGLGLWIVHRIVELHGARIRLLDSPLGGLRVEVVFAPAAVTVSSAPSDDTALRLGRAAA